MSNGSTGPLQDPRQHYMLLLWSVYYRCNYRSVHTDNGIAFVIACYHMKAVMVMILYKSNDYMRNYMTVDSNVLLAWYHSFVRFIFY